jgi:predicted dehydrogenase
VETDLQAALAHEPDAVIVSNPTALHLDVAIPAAEAGCHLLLEKPISHSMRRLDLLQDAVERGSGRVLVGFQYRYHPQLHQIAAFLDDGAIARPVAARVHWGEYLPAWHPWEDYRKGYSARKDLGGGVILTLSHPLDYLRWLLGDVDALWAFTSQAEPLEIEVESIAEIGLKFTNGVLASVHLDYVQRPHSHRLEIVGTGGTIRWDYVRGELRVFRAEAEQWQSYPLPDDFERNDLFRDEMAHFLDVVCGEAKPMCTLQDGIWAQKLAMAAHDSSASGRIIRWDGR